MYLHPVINPRKVRFSVSFYSPYLHGKRIQYNLQYANCQEIFRTKPLIFGLSKQEYLDFRPTPVEHIKNTRNCGCFL